MKKVKRVGNPTPASGGGISAAHIVNVVSTVWLLEQGKGLSLSLQAIATHLGHCSQYAIDQFAGNILRFTNSTTDSTVLVFSSGKVVLVGALSKRHTLYMCQMIRIILEQAVCLLKDPLKGTIEVGTLTGRTVFDQKGTNNIVGHGDLGFEVDLQRLRDANPGSVKYIPDLFPAAKCGVWITPDKRCHCSAQKCKCTIKCLCFKTGRIVMTGGTNMRDVNTVFNHMKAIIVDYEYKNVDNQMVPHKGASDPGSKRVLGTLSASEAISVATEFRGGVSLSSYSSTATPVVAPFVVMCLSGHLKAVQTTMAIEPPSEELKQEAIKKLLLLPNKTPEHEAVLSFLSK